MMDSNPFSSEDADLSAEPAGESPRHGFRGPPEASPGRGVPAALTIAISRETGARGASIAKRVGHKLGWQVYTQELLEYIAQEGTFRQELADQLSAEARSWVEEQYNRLLREQNMSLNPSILELSRIILALGTQGDVVLLGRGAGCILPAVSTLHVRLIAPRTDRIAYMSQWMRLTEEEAATLVEQRDTARAEFLSTHFHRSPDAVYQYDMLLNTSTLGEERSAELIYHAAMGKKAIMSGPAEGLVEEGGT
jgi:cytidylate kinase